MTVTAILNRKGSEVVTIEPSADLFTVIKRLQEKHIGALVVTGPDGRIVGIISERDVVRALAERGQRALAEPISVMMTRNVVTCIPNETVIALMARMTAGKFRHMPVAEQGCLAGIVSIGDVVKSRLDEIGRESADLREYIRTA
jgi:CBS domain-containing protein